MIPKYPIGDPDCWAKAAPRSGHAAHYFHPESGRSVCGRVTRFHLTGGLVQYLCLSCLDGLWAAKSRETK